MMRKLITSAAVAAALASGIALAAPANATDGGHSYTGEEHYWLKVPQRDSGSNPATRFSSYQSQCAGKYIIAPACDIMASMLVAQKQGAPGANGYWAEWYPKSGIKRSGTW
jgi:hypothetical protein